VPAIKNATSKNQTFYALLWNNISPSCNNVVFKTTFRQLDTEFKKKPNWFHLLPHHICSLRSQIKHRTAAIFGTTSSPVGCAFWVPTIVGPLCLVVPFILYQGFHLYAAKPY